MIIDIGGQDSKIIYLDSKYAVKNFSMNDKCAAGTGKFMEVIAQILETTIDNVGPLSLEATNPCDINSTCVVFAQSEVISLVARKYDRRDILAGMHISMVRRIVKMMKKSEKDGDILPVGFAAILGAVFALASTISPVLFIILISGALEKRMNKEIPQYLTWFRLGCYVLMIVLFAAGLIKEVIK